MELPNEKVVVFRRTRSLAPREERPADATWRNSLHLDHSRKERCRLESSPPSRNRRPISPVNGSNHLRSHPRRPLSRPPSRGGNGGNRPRWQGIIKDHVSISIDDMPPVEERRVEEEREDGVAGRRRGWVWDVFDKLLEGDEEGDEGGDDEGGDEGGDDEGGDEGGDDGGGEVEEQGWTVLKLLACFFEGLERLMPLLALLAKGHSDSKPLLVLAFIPLIGTVVSTLASQGLISNEYRMVGRILTVGSAIWFTIICFMLPKQGAMDSIGAV